MTWRKSRDKDGPLVVWREKLSNGKVLRLTFSINNWYEGETIIMPHLVVHRPGMKALAWRRAGKPTGTAGVETWARVMDIWDSGVDAALKMTTAPYVEVQVDAETPQLLRIYRNRLERHGYTYEGRSEDPYLWRVLRYA